MLERFSMLVNAARLFSFVSLVLFHTTVTAAPTSVGEETLAALQGIAILHGSATGANSSHVLKQLQDLGLDVRGMTRNVDRAIKKFGSQYAWIKADVTDSDLSRAVVEGVDIVISAVASMMPFGSNTSEKVDYEGTLNLANAANAAGATRIVIITSSSGVKDRFLNTIGGNALIWKGRAEQVLVDSGMEYVVVGPAAIDDSPGAQQMISLIPRSGHRAGMVIGREDLASVVIAACRSDAANRVFTATNADGVASDGWLSRFAELSADLNLPPE